jgi:hypothetical protein
MLEQAANDANKSIANEYTPIFLHSEVLFDLRDHAYAANHGQELQVDLEMNCICYNYGLADVLHPDVEITAVIYVDEKPRFCKPEPENGASPAGRN